MCVPPSESSASRLMWKHSCSERLRNDRMTSAPTLNILSVSAFRFSDWRGSVHLSEMGQLLWKEMSESDGCTHVVMNVCSQTRTSDSQLDEKHKSLLALLKQESPPPLSVRWMLDPEEGFWMRHCWSYTHKPWPGSILNRSSGSGFFLFLVWALNFYPNRRENDEIQLKFRNLDPKEKLKPKYKQIKECNPEGRTADWFIHLLS